MKKWIVIAIIIFDTINSHAVIWEDIYGREESAIRLQMSVNCGYSSAGGCSKYFAKGKYSNIKGYYHGSWANFDEWKIHWEYDHICQYNVDFDKGSGCISYIKIDGKWIDEDEGFLEKQRKLEREFRNKEGRVENEQILFWSGLGSLFVIFLYFLCRKKY